MREELEEEGDSEERREGQGDVAHPPPHLASLIVHSAVGAVSGEMAAVAIRCAQVIERGWGDGSREEGIG
jgi:hypothetical protein